MAQSAVDEVSETGAFTRSASSFRYIISRDPNSSFPAEPGRYHLYISYACPWASRCLSYLKIKGLDNAISFSVNPLPSLKKIQGHSPLHTSYKNVFI